MAIIRWDPFSEISSLRQEMDRLLGRSDSEQMFVPAVDVIDADDEIVIKAEIPGVSPDDLELSVDDNILSIRGERRFEEKTEEDRFYRIEQRYGRFERYISLPVGTDVDAIDANCENGVLEIHVPKPEQVEPRRLNIRGGGGQQQIETHGERQTEGGETQEGMAGGEMERETAQGESSQSTSDVPMRTEVDMDKVSRSEMPYATEREVEEGMEAGEGEQGERGRQAA